MAGIAGDSDEQIRNRAAPAYAKYQNVVSWGTPTPDQRLAVRTLTHPIQHFPQRPITRILVL